MMYDFAKSALHRNDLGSFIAGQVIADLKYVEPLRSAEDWETFAVSGPGSRRGLNLVLGRRADQKWDETYWFEALSKLREQTRPLFEAAGMEVPHAQDLRPGVVAAHRAMQRVGGGSRRGLESDAHPVGSSPHDDAMPCEVVEVQVEAHWQTDGIPQPQRGPGGRKVANRAIYGDPSDQGDPADHQNVMPWDESAFGSPVGGSAHQPPPRRVPISGERRRQRRQDRNASGSSLK
jgi:hypothetical protein